MNILILNGSPRREGDTAQLIQLFRQALKTQTGILQTDSAAQSCPEAVTAPNTAAAADTCAAGISQITAATNASGKAGADALQFTEFHAYDGGFLPCIDCRFCITNDHCCLNDKMQLVYDALERCDAVIFASPLFYCSLTGQLLDLASRFQFYYHRKQYPPRKKAALLLTGGGNGGPEAALQSAKTICRSINAQYIGAAMSLQTDHIPVTEDRALPAQLDALAKALLTAD